MMLTRERLERVQSGRCLKAPTDPLAPEKGSLTECQPAAPLPLLFFSPLKVCKAFFKEITSHGHT